MIKIRETTTADADALARLARQVTDGDAVHAASVDDWRRALEREDVVVLVAEDNALPVGYAVLVRTALPAAGRAVLFLETIAVRSAWRGCGVGRRIMRAVARVAADDDATVTVPHAPDAHTRGFFLRLGGELRPAVTVRWEPEHYRALAERAA